MLNPVKLIADGFRIVTAVGNVGEHVYNLAAGDARDAEAAIADLASVIADLGVAVKVGSNERFAAALVGADILTSAITVVEYFEQTTGFGRPSTGDALILGANQFTALSGQLMSAVPDQRWRGTASGAYGEYNVGLNDGAQQLAALDRQLAQLIDDQARWVIHARLALAAIKVGLIGCVAIALALEAWERSTAYTADVLIQPAWEAKIAEAWFRSEVVDSQSALEMANLAYQSPGQGADAQGGVAVAMNDVDAAQQNYQGREAAASNARKTADASQAAADRAVTLSRWFQGVASVVGIGAAASILVYAGAIRSRENADQAADLAVGYDKLARVQG